MLKTDDGYLLTVKVTPNSSKEQIVLLGDIVKIKVNTPPVDGKANLRVIQLLSKALNISKSKITIISGHTSKTKVILVKSQQQLSFDF